MFKFLKDKLKEAVSSFSKKVDEEAETVEEKAPVEEKSKVEKTPVKKSTPKKKEEPEKVEKKQPVKKESPKADKSAKSSETKVSETKVEEKPKEEKKKESVKNQSKTSEKKTTPTKKETSAEEKKPVVVKEEKIEEPLVQEITEELVTEEKAAEDKPKKKGFLGGLFSKKKDEEPVIEDVTEEEKPSTEEAEQARNVAEEKTPEKPKKKGLFSAITDTITKKKLSDSQFEDLFFDLELMLLENNTALEVIEKIKEDLKKELVDTPIDRSKVGDIIQNTLKKSIQEVLDVPTIDIIQKVKEKNPYVISFVGVNGAGKTTHLAKLVQHFKNNNLTCVIAACDTFRAAAIQQLEEHANKLETKMIKHEYGSDAAAVAFDAVAHAKSKGLDVVLIDTAGRLHSNSNLMDELRKINKVVNPDFTIFVGESITGNDCVEQAVQFNEAVGIDGIILSKADVDEKGGAAISISYVTSKPILFLGVGQTYADLVPFEPSVVLESLGL